MINYTHGFMLFALMRGIKKPLTLSDAIFGGSIVLIAYLIYKIFNRRDS